MTIFADKKRKAMTYQAVKYNSKEEALSAYRKMIERKKQWIEESERYFQQMAEYRRQAACQ